MKNVFRVSVALLLLAVLHLNTMQVVQACGPSELTPVFDYSYAPERPWTDFASGKLGIIKPGYRRSVLFAAYRYLNGSGFSAPEQQALVETWEAQFNRVDPDENSLAKAVEGWVKARKSVVGDTEKTPDIYTDRKYDSYDFFPNCSKNAFEVASATLSDRAGSYGSDSKDVRDWLAAQDQVFNNCAGGKADIKELGADAPDWLRKDRDYQLAAAAFYSTNYDDARTRFQNIANDAESPWREVADYLVGRTLVRRASLVNDGPQAGAYDKEAEDYLSGLVGRANTYNNDSRRLLNLIKFRIHPEQRERELAQKLPFQNDPAELRQDLIDYSWLLDQLESEALKKEEARKEALKPPEANANTNSAMNTGSPVITNNPDPGADQYEKIQRGEMISFYISNPNPALANTSSGSTSFAFDANLTDEAIQQSVETQLGRSLTDAERTSIAAARSESFHNRLSYSGSNYKGGYYGSEIPSLSLLPSFLGDDELTEWIFTYEIQNDEAYLHALERWKQTSSQMWLMTAITKTRPDLAGFRDVMEAAKEVSPSSPAYYTIAYHRARILIEQGNKIEARKLLAGILDGPGDMPISTRNLFTQQRMKVADTLSEFLAAATRRPFGFSYDDDTAHTIDELIAERKSWYDPESDEVPQAQFDADIEKEFADRKIWQDRQFFDDDTVEIINSNFPTSLMVEALAKPELPDYLKRRLTYTVWTRAYLLKDEKTALALAPAVVALKPSIEPYMTGYVSAKTPAERDLAGLYLLLKNGDMSPYLQTGFDPVSEPDFDMWQDDRWWCEQYDMNYDDSGNEVPKPPFVAPFLSRQQSDQARLQKANLKKMADGLTYLGTRVLKWANSGVPDRRLPEALYIVFQANQWVKYSCGNASEETRKTAGDLLKTRYPRSKWTAKMFADLREAESQ
jgi:hypothetical protein